MNGLVWCMFLCFVCLPQCYSTQEIDVFDKFQNSSNLLWHSPLLNPLVDNNTPTLPRNISDMYKGNRTWNELFLTNLGMWQLHSLPKNDSRSFSQIFEFNRREGHVMFHLQNSPTILKNVDSVKGDWLILRDGIYSTDNNKKFITQGLYFWRQGIIFLVVNPASDPVMEDFVMSIGQNTSLIAAIEMANSNALKVLNKEVESRINGTNSMNNEKEHLSQCYFYAVFQMDPVSVDFNEQYAPFYEGRLNSGEKLEKPALSMNGMLKSPNCEFDIQINALSFPLSVYFAKAVNYAVMISVVSSVSLFFSWMVFLDIANMSFVEIILLIRQMEYTNTQSTASRVSVLTIGIQAMMDSYLCLVHLTAGIAVEDLFNSFATTAFFKFVTFSFFEMRYLLIIWKARRPQAFLEHDSMRRELGLLYTTFYVCLMGGFVLFYYMNGLFTVFIFVMYSFFVPQIVCNARRDSNRALVPQYIVGMAVTRVLIPLYFLGCPYNFLHVEPNFTAVKWLLSWVSLQVIIIFLQDFLGPRFFVPKQCLPEKYNYFQKITLSAEDLPECVICMNTVDPREKNYMVTPCQHLFHSECLMQWLDQKMECPTCRGMLPNV